MSCLQNMRSQRVKGGDPAVAVETDEEMRGGSVEQEMISKQSFPAGFVVFNGNCFLFPFNSCFPFSETGNQHNGKFLMQDYSVVFARVCGLRNRDQGCV